MYLDQSLGVGSRKSSYVSLASAFFGRMEVNLETGQAASDGLVLGDSKDLASRIPIDLSQQS